MGQPRKERRAGGRGAFGFWGQDCFGLVDVIESFAQKHEQGDLDHEDGHGHDQGRDKRGKGLTLRRMRDARANDSRVGHFKRALGFNSNKGSTVGTRTLRKKRA